MIQQHIVSLKCSKTTRKEKTYEQFAIPIPLEFINRHRDIFKTKDKILLFTPHETSPFMLLIPEKFWWSNEYTRKQIIKFLEEFEWVI